MIDMLDHGYWKKSEDGKYICIGFLYGGHMGGECEILLPKELLAKFLADNAWRKKTVNKFSRIVYLAAPKMNVPLPESEKHKDGIVPDDWC